MNTNIKTQSHGKLMMVAYIYIYRERERERDLTGVEWKKKKKKNFDFTVASTGIIPKRCYQITCAGMRKWERTIVLECRVLQRRK